MAAIGTGWADTAWIEAAWITEAWDDAENVAVEVVAGGVKAKKRNIKVVDKSFFPWTQQPDPIEKEFIKELKKPKLKVVKRAPQPDFDQALESERLDRELVQELKRIEKERIKRARRHKAAIMLLLS